jgi:hypothetical protein
VWRGIGGIPFSRPSVVSIVGSRRRGQRGWTTITAVGWIWRVASPEFWWRRRRITVSVVHGWRSPPVVFEVTTTTRRGWQRIVPKLPWRRRPSIISRRVVIASISRGITSRIITQR